MSKQTFNIFNDAGMMLATVSFYGLGVNSANKEAQKIASSLSDKWAIARVEKPES